MCTSGIFNISESSNIGTYKPVFVLFIRCKNKCLQNIYLCIVYILTTGFELL